MNDPYDPEPVPVSTATGKELLSATFALLRQDKQMLALPFVGSALGLIVAAILFVPGYGLVWLANGHEGGRLAWYAGAAFAGFGATIVSVFFQTALVIGANERADGGNPTVESCLQRAWTYRRRILSWSIVTATVGFVLMVIHDRLGFLGPLLNWFGGLAWGIATFVVVPVLVAEDVGPVTATKRSIKVLRDTWGTSLRTAFRGGVIATVLWVFPLVAFFASLAMVIYGSSGVFAAGVVLLVVSGLSLVVVETIVGAAGTYARALIYRYAVGLPTPGIDSRVFVRAFYPKL